VETAQAKQAVNDKEQTQTVDPEVNLAEQEEIEQSAVKFVATVMQSLSIHGKMSSYFDEEGTLHLNIIGDNVGAAIGRRGETLDALQYLTILAVNKDREEYTRVSLDIGGYRERRIKTWLKMQDVPLIVYYVPEKDTP